jgi:SprB repeat
MKKINIVIALVIAVLFIMPSTLAFKKAGIAGKTGSPGENTCGECHGGSASGSSILSSNIPATGYVPGTVYSVTLTVAESGLSLFGLGLEALNSGNTNGGTLTPGTGTQILLSGSRRNIVQTLNGGASAGSHAFTFSWTAPAASTGDVTFYYTGLAANGNGSSDGGDHSYTGSAIFSPLTSTLTATTTTTSVLCFGGNTGTATVNPSGGSNYTYNWSNNQTTQTATNLTAGTYTVTVTSGAQSVIATATVTQPATAVNGTTSVSNVISCANPTATLTANGSGGTAPYSYIWSTTETTPSIVVSTAGTYSVTIFDNNNCSIVKTATVTGSCACPNLTNAPDNVGIVNSVCSSNCNLILGVISPPINSCGAGSTLQYSINGGTWNTTLPIYTQSVQNIRTRCVCNTDPNIVSPISTTVSTAPATCIVPSTPTISIVNNVCPSTTGSITANGCGSGTVVEYATTAGGPYSTTAPLYTTSSFTVFARCRDLSTSKCNNCSCYLCYMSKFEYSTGECKYSE